MNNNKKKEIIDLNSQDFLDDFNQMINEMPKHLHRGFWECQRKYRFWSVKRAIRTISPKKAKDHFGYATIRAKKNFPMICPECQRAIKKGYFLTSVSPTINGLGFRCRVCTVVHLMTGN